VVEFVLEAVPEALYEVALAHEEELFHGEEVLGEVELLVEHLY